MSHSAPPIPPDQRAPGPDAAAGQDPTTDGARSGADSTRGLDDRRDRATGVDTRSKGDAEVNTSEQGRFGDIKQNTTHQGYQQDR